MDYQAIAKEILKDVGGKDNIVDVTHCYTRLRFVLKDTKQANKKPYYKQKVSFLLLKAAGSIKWF